MLNKCQIDISQAFFLFSIFLFNLRKSGWPLGREMGRQSLPFPHAGREIPQKNFPSPMREGKLKFFFSRSEKWEENLFSFRKKSLILLILVDKNSFFHDFFSCGKGNSKKSLSFSHAKREIPQKSFPFPMEKGNWKKFLPASLSFPSRSPCRKSFECLSSYFKFFYLSWCFCSFSIMFKILFLVQIRMFFMNFTTFFIFSFVLNSVRNITKIFMFFFNSLCSLI